ncbi:MAG: hypothetical protein VYA54_00180 [Bdellovibrionota bacterium]|nr:hypothetical protein [Bdellovibrionota bacterium]
MKKLLPLALMMTSFAQATVVDVNYDYKSNGELLKFDLSKEVMDLEIAHETDENGERQSQPQGYDSIEDMYDQLNNMQMILISARNNPYLENMIERARKSKGYLNGVNAQYSVYGFEKDLKLEDLTEEQIAFIKANNDVPAMMQINIASPGGNSWDDDSLQCDQVAKADLENLKVDKTTRCFVSVKNEYLKQILLSSAKGVKAFSNDEVKTIIEENNFSVAESNTEAMTMVEKYGELGIGLAAGSKHYKGITKLVLADGELRASFSGNHLKATYEDLTRDVNNTEQRVFSSKIALMGSLEHANNGKDVECYKETTSIGGAQDLLVETQEKDENCEPVMKAQTLNLSADISQYSCTVAIDMDQYLSRIN